MLCANLQTRCWARGAVANRISDDKLAACVIGKQTKSRFQREKEERAMARAAQLCCGEVWPLWLQLR